MQTAVNDTQPIAAQRKGQGLAVVEPAAPGVRARQLFDEARKAAQEHLVRLEASIDETRALAEAVVAAGDLYGPGVTDLAARLAEDLVWRAKSLEALALRQGDLRRAGGYS
jgi:hypothetical protein